jgi:hypothetical protein
MLNEKAQAFVQTSKNLTKPTVQKNVLAHAFWWKYDQNYGLWAASSLLNCEASWTSSIIVSTLPRSVSPGPANIRTEIVQVVEALPLHNLTGPVGQQFASHPGGAAVCVPGMHPHLQWNRVGL